MEKTIYSRHVEAFRAKIVAIRMAAGLSQRQLAKKLRRVHSVIAHIEQGQRRVDTLEFFKICKACGASPAKAARELMEIYEKIDKAKT